MSPEARPCLPRPRRQRPMLRLLSALLVLLGALASARASLPRQLNGMPTPKPTRGGGPQTGTGTSDAVRTVVPPKNRG